MNVKNIRIFNGLWGADWKFHHESNCSASRGLPSDAEQLPEWQNFQFAPKNHYGFFFLHTVTATVPSRIAFRLEYVLFYQFYLKIGTFFDQERFGTAPILHVDVETFAWNWRQNDVKTSKSSYWRHARESSYTPHVRRHLLAPVGFMEIPVGYARNLILKCIKCYCILFNADNIDSIVFMITNFYYFHSKISIHASHDMPCLSCPLNQT